MNTRTSTLLAGDLVVLALVTLYGFASHGELGTAGTRLLTTFIPLVVAWLLVAPHLGVYDADRAADSRQVWRPFWAMVLAGPFAGWLRGLILGWLAGAPLGQPVQPLFVVILGGVAALALLAWRALYLLIATRRRAVHG
jgi:hypothetical protein